MMTHAPGIFPCDPTGYVRHWLVVGPHSTPYTGPGAEDNTLRSQALDHTIAQPVRSEGPGVAGPFGQPWRFYYPGENIFLETSTFYYKTAVVDLYAYTEIEAPADARRAATIWSCGTADVWVNEEHQLHFDVGRYMWPGSKAMDLPLRQGINRVCVRLQAFGVRDTRHLFGLQFAEAGGLKILVPGAANLAQSSGWLDTVRAPKGGVLNAQTAPPFASQVTAPGLAQNWPLTSTSIELQPTVSGELPSLLNVTITSEGQTLERHLEIPAHRPQDGVVPEDRRRAHLEYIAGPREKPNGLLRPHTSPLRMLARRLLGRPDPSVDDEMFAAVISTIQGREDCSDFGFAGLLRMEMLGLNTPEESAVIKREALAYRYWSDEPGSDAMCFWGENHSLLFHGCQMIAGTLYPGEIFTNSGRTGQEQAAIGFDRCRGWIEHLEPRGFDEFNSSTYLPLTLAAMLNAAQFCGDEGLAARFHKAIDGMLELLAAHAFRGVVISPQGRVYRNVLQPEISGTQTLLSFFTPGIPDKLTGAPETTERHGDWLAFPASAPGYTPPVELAALATTPASRRYRQSYAEIVLHKSDDYLLTSLAIPATTPSSGRPEAELRPGGAGYQQHVWQATLGPGCHVFVNHPGCTFDESKSRPGYWYGNGVLPRLRQREGLLEAIYLIPDGSRPVDPEADTQWYWPPNSLVPPFSIHPVPFTHAYWPAEVFDEQHREGHWAFGRKDDAYIALWCSAELKAHDDVLTNYELRAWGAATAWVARCVSARDDASFGDFQESCRAAAPVFDPRELILRTPGESALAWSA